MACDIDAAAVVAAGGDGASTNFDFAKGCAILSVAARVGDIYDFRAGSADHEIAAYVYYDRTYAGDCERGIGSVSGDVAFGETVQGNRGEVEVGGGLPGAVETPVRMKDFVHGGGDLGLRGF